jgi:hypothetical protein
VLQLELRDDSGLLIASDVAETSALGWNGQGRLSATLTVPSLPLAFGRFHLRLGLTDASGDELLHWLDDALVFHVYSDNEERGLVRLGGAWARGSNSVAP